MKTIFLACIIAAGMALPAVETVSDAKDDRLFFDFAAPFREIGDDWGDAIYVPFSNTYDAVVEVSSVSLPALTVSGLPKGISFDRNSMKISGKASVPGLYTVKVSGTNKNKYSFSQIFRLAVTGYSSAHVGTFDEYLYVGDEVDMGIEDLFCIDTPATNGVKSLTLAGLPSGLALRKETVGGQTWYSVKGTPGKSGFYPVTATVTFADNTKETAVSTLTVEGPDPADYGVWLDALESCRVGDVLPAEDEICIGCYDKKLKVGLKSISGLPTGVKVLKVSDEFEDWYYLAGMLSKPGEFAVTANVAYEDWDTGKTQSASVARTVIVEDVPDRYFMVAVADAANAPGCKATGGGVCAMGTTVKIGATAGKDFVFAGWHDAEGTPVFDGMVDYRTASQSVFADANAQMERYAHFVPKKQDRISIDGVRPLYALDTENGTEEPFMVDSPSLPKLTAKNLPAGMKCGVSPHFPGEYLLTYDPASVKKAPAPGKYAVTLTAENLSKNKDVSEFIVKVANVTNANIRVADDYGVLTPNAAMAPISLSNAVDFARGDTLKVSGLPAGLKYDDKSAPLCISGIPSKPGEYTLEFTARIVAEAVTNGTRVTYRHETATATAYITVKDFPEIVIISGEDALASGNKVSGAGNYKPGAKAALKATAANGWVFTGWTGLGDLGLAGLTPSFAYTVGYDDFTYIGAEFAEIRDDYLWIDEIPDIELDVGEDVAAAGKMTAIATAIRTRSLPEVTVASLPAGVKWDSKTFSLSGKPSKAGVCHVTVSAKNAGGYRHSRIVRFVIGGAEEVAGQNGVGISEDDFEEFEAELYTGNNAMEAAFALPPSLSGSRVNRVAVSGLPADIKYILEDWDGEDVLTLYGTGCLAKPGRYTLAIEATYEDRSKSRTLRSFILRDSGSRYLDVAVEKGSENMGTVSGSGVYAYGDRLKLKATAGRDNVFAGWYGHHYASDYAGGDWISGNIEEWYDACWLTDSKGNAVDYRTPSPAAVVADDDLVETEFGYGRVETVYARFAAKTDDGEITLHAGGKVLDGAVFEVLHDGEEGWSLDISENSKSLPGKIAFKGIPAGMKAYYSAESSGIEVTAPASLKPGVYKVTASVSNVSKAKGEAAFTLIVPNFTAAALPNLDPATDAYPVCVGVGAPEDLVDFTFGEGWEGATISASGLPAGMKLVKLEDAESGNGGFYYAISGVPSKACTNTVTFKVTDPATRETAIATITLSVAALPAWACGNFDGVFSVYEETSDGLWCVPAGTLSATISAQGRISGKVLRGGRQYPFTAASFDFCEDQDSGLEFHAAVAISWSAADKVSYKLSVFRREDGCGAMKLADSRYCCGIVSEGVGIGEAVQNVWKRSDFEIAGFAAGAKAPVLQCDGLTLKFGANGAITASGTIDGIRVSGNAQTLYRSCLEDGSAEAQSVLYFTNGAFEGGAYTDVCSFVLSDRDGDGKFDTAVRAD